ncbi:monoheme cytochrome C [Lutimonas halocynthiae]|uniref:monoheme cytochrome C n=1 Tax=Lutimonas halocynthiae TaxID=1446477 RepID=UPI0025B2B934|nr:monoheme cytochrome C [Lutimonas halocynthiae]MDN3644042.1 monoheme cytochrome C [Lutimonas halocynthiae]
MENRNKNHDLDSINKRKLFGFIVVIGMLILFVGGLFLYVQSNNKPQNIPNDPVFTSNEIENGIHVRTGLKEGEGLMVVVAHCTACHSAQLIIQNRMNKERWNATIRWMQETQNLWELGAQQEVIVNYLVKNYPVYSKGRRENLQDIEWYKLSD